MGKKTEVVFLCMLFVSALGSVFILAQDADGDGIDDETEAEIEIMDINHGAEMRILQLQRSIQITIVRANTVVSYLKDKGQSTDVFEEIVSELELLKEEASSMENFTSNEEAVKSFVEIKLDSIKLVREFKTELLNVINEGERNILRQRLREVNQNTVRDIDRRIVEARHELNRRRIDAVSDSLGRNLSDIRNEYEDGNLTLEQVRERLRIEYNSMGELDKQRIAQRLRERYIEMKEIRHERINEFVNVRPDRIRDRSAERDQMLKDMRQIRDTVQTQNRTMVDINQRGEY